MSRVLAYGFGLAVVALVAAPGFQHPDEDSYPLSTYPMFARTREKPWLDFVEGVDEHAEPVRLPPRIVANDEVMQAAAAVRRAVSQGPTELAPFCASVALRIAESHELTQVRQVRIVGARFDPVRYFVEGPAPEQRSVHWQCDVVRSTP